MKRIVFATNNVHKLEEARQIAGDRAEIVSLAEIGCHDDIPETAPDLEGNSRIKAEWIYKRYGYPCFADDTGLFVDALDGAPGVYSARYAGDHCSADDNIDLLLRQLEGIEPEKRTARFRTVVTLIEADGSERRFEGRVEGRIDTGRTGGKGFGYDPVFIADETGLSFAAMTAEAKNAISHRGRAIRKLFDYLLK